MADLKGRTVIITGGSRGIGREIALRCAKDGANVVLAAKTAEPDGKLPGTIFTVAEEVEKAGGKALGFKVDVRNEAEVQALVEATVKRFGGVDILVNNAGAIQLTPTEATPAKRFDLMQQINVRAVFLCTQAALPYLKKGKSPHILNLSPPINLDPKWLAPHVAYTISKYGMSLCTLGHAAEFRAYGIAVNSLWPKRLIATAATQMLLGEKMFAQMRKPQIMADAAYAILSSTGLEHTGKCWLDEEVLALQGVTNLDGYAVTPGARILPDLYID